MLAKIGNFDRSPSLLGRLMSADTSRSPIGGRTRIDGRRTILHDAAHKLMHQMRVRPMMAATLLK